MPRVISRDPFAPGPAKRSGFWVRQFSDVSTEKQDRFDVVFGIVLPVICLVLDPLVFQGGFLGERPLLARFQLFAYLFCGLQIGIFLCWRTLARHLAPAAGLIGGILLGGALFSLVVGVLILPLTLFGLIILIGIVGFTPFVTAFVYLRTGIRALRAQQRNVLFESRFLLAVMAAFLSAVMPILISYKVSTTISAAMDQIIYGNPQEARVAVDRLKWLHIPSTQLELMVLAYSRETNSGKKDVLKRYYKELTGEDIDHKLFTLND